MWLWIPILYVSVNKYPVTCVREAGIATVMPVVLKTSPWRMATKRYLTRDLRKWCLGANFSKITFCYFLMP